MGIRIAEEVKIVHGRLRAWAGDFEQAADFLYETQGTVQGLLLLRRTLLSLLLSLHLKANIIRILGRRL
jgi:hypothetical protein